MVASGRWSTYVRVLVVALGIFFGQKIIAPLCATIALLFFGIPALDNSEAFIWIVSIFTALILFLFVEFSLFRVRREGFTV